MTVYTGVVFCSSRHLLGVVQQILQEMWGGGGGAATQMLCDMGDVMVWSLVWTGSGSRSKVQRFLVASGQADSAPFTLVLQSLHLSLPICKMDIQKHRICLGWTFMSTEHSALHVVTAT
jgi:hypothetical protein